MTARTLPNLGLKAFFSFGEDGWNTDLDSNFLKLSVLTQGGAIDFIASKPVSPAEGAVYVLTAFASSNANAVAVFDNGAWVHFPPKAGWTIYNRANDSYLTWTGTSWQTMFLPNLRALGGLNTTTLGLIEQTGANTFSKRAIGASFGADILTRDGGDGRYALIGHTHPVTGVTAFNTRAGDVTLTTNDVQAALGFLPATSSPILTNLSLLGSTSGIVEQTGTSSFAKRQIGVGASDLLTGALGDQRYQGLHATLTGLSAVSASDLGVVEQVSARQFRIRPVGVANSTDLLTRGAADSIYVTASNFSLSQLNDVPDSYLGKAQYSLAVNNSENAVMFKAPGQVVVTTQTSDYTLTLPDAGSHIRVINSSGATVTVPTNANVAFKIGTTLSLTQAGQGAITINGAVGVTVDYPFDRSNVTRGHNGVVHLIQYDVDCWTLYGDLA